MVREGESNFAMQALLLLSLNFYFLVYILICIRIKLHCKYSADEPDHQQIK